MPQEAQLLSCKTKFGLSPPQRMAAQGPALPIFARFVMTRPAGPLKALPHFMQLNTASPSSQIHAL
jgi:hypothetical protein